MNACKIDRPVRKRHAQTIYPLFFILLTASFLIGAASTRAATGGKPSIRVVAPTNKTWLTQETVFLAGTINPALKQVTIKGVKVLSYKKDKIPATGGGFGTLIKLKKGLNTLKISGDKSSVEIKIYYLPESDLKKGKSAPEGFSRFYVHSDPSVLKCKECHRFRRGAYNFKRVTPAPFNCTTGECHSDMGKDAHVHGPVGAGVCIACHNPHGSSMPLELERSGQELCFVCHQAKQKEFDKKVIHAPVEEGCTDCHDPHQSPMRFQLRGEGKSVSSLCFNCHDQDAFTKKHTHGPVGTGGCIACHLPHASDNNALLIAPPDKGELCFKCHQDRKKEFTMKFVHEPAGDDCSQCHDPHSSDFRFQLQKPDGELCKMCHEDMNTDIYDDIARKYKHKPVAEGHCTACHNPHSSNEQPLLQNSMGPLCLSCHVDLADTIKESKYKHGPVQTGDCVACHKVHGSDFSNLLVRYYPSTFYIDYKQDYYDLCFGCHNKDVARKKFTTALTNFRDGDYNLHFFHVNRKKGRVCTACHAPHASNQPKHIRNEVPFGMWSYPISFTKNATGGTCVVGCHSPKTYDRKHPVGYVK